ncbi:MAG: (2Fe-2S)-binding protein [Thermaerobacter sp.]|nr:(2Fe-2S)-binding protein [Thermaerobacter sp.]
MIELKVNGRAVRRDAEPRTLLVDFLREDLALTGTKIGCDTSQCGACTVLLDGHAVKSCNLLAVQAQGKHVVTVEGLKDLVPEKLREEGLHPLQAAFWNEHALQCGFCTPGMLMSACDLLLENPDPSPDEVRHGLEGNLCRCTGYEPIVIGVRRAGKSLRDAGITPLGTPREGVAK